MQVSVNRKFTKPHLHLFVTNLTEGHLLLYGGRALGCPMFEILRYAKRRKTKATNIDAYCVVPLYDLGVGIHESWLSRLHKGIENMAFFNAHHALRRV